MIEPSPDTGVPPLIAQRPLAIDARLWLNRLLAGNPLYLISAGLLLYGINILTTDPRFVGAESSMLRFNFCALAAYEVMLVITAIALARRRIWSDAMLLIALSSAFVIVPFSLVSRAAWLSHELAWVMCGVASLFAALKLWAFKRFIPGLNLPRRLLLFGAVLLLANAVAPMRFKAMTDDYGQIHQWLRIIGFAVLPVLAALANALPRPVESGPSLGQRRWVPMAFYFGWIGVTTGHFLGLAHSSGVEWSWSLIVPAAWVVGWTLHLRIMDFNGNPDGRLRHTLLSVPLAIPLFAGGIPDLLPVLAALNVGCYGARFLFKDRGRVAMIQLLAAAAIFLSGLPQAWLNRIVPDLGRPEWVLCSFFLCFLWLTFRSRDPRVGFIAAVGLALGVKLMFPGHGAHAVQFGLVFVLLHSLRWNDPAFNGSKFSRIGAGLLWLAHSWWWLREDAGDARLPVYGAVSLLLICYTARSLLNHRWDLRAIPAFGVGVLVCEPSTVLTHEVGGVPHGLIAIVASFVLFGLGSLLAFTRSRWSGRF